MIDLRFFALVLRGPANLVDDVTRIARTQFLFQRAMYEVDECVRHALIALHLAVACNSAEDLAELFVADLANENLGLDRKSVV